MAEQRHGGGAYPRRGEGGHRRGDWDDANFQRGSGVLHRSQSLSQAGHRSDEPRRNSDHFQGSRQLYGSRGQSRGGGQWQVETSAGSEAQFCTLCSVPLLSYQQTQAHLMSRQHLDSIVRHPEMMLQDVIVSQQSVGGGHGWASQSREGGGGGGDGGENLAQKYGLSEIEIAHNNQISLLQQVSQWRGGGV